MNARITTTALLLAVILPVFGGAALGQTDGLAVASIDDVQMVLEEESTRSALTPEQWKAYGRRLTEAMESDNEGVQRSALRLAAYHGDRLQMGRSATISAVKFYRDDPDPYVRKLAVVAIARINHPWGIDFLTRSLAYEDSSGVEKVMRSMLQESSTEN